MKESHICTINHFLLLKWPSGYPDIKRLIIDEAHNIEKVAFDKFSDRVSLLDIRLFLKKLVRVNEKVLLNNLKNYSKKYFHTSVLDPAFEAFARMEIQLGQISFELRTLSNVIGMNPDYGFHRAIPISDDWSPLKTAAVMCSETLSSLAEEIDSVLESIAYKDEGFISSFIYSQGKRYSGVCKS